MPRVARRKGLVVVACAECGSLCILRLNVPYRLRLKFALSYAACSYESTEIRRSKNKECVKVALTWTVCPNMIGATYRYVADVSCVEYICLGKIASDWERVKAVTYVLIAVTSCVKEYAATEDLKSCVASLASGRVALTRGSNGQFRSRIESQMSFRVDFLLW